MGPEETPEVPTLLGTRVCFMICDLESNLLENSQKDTGNGLEKIASKWNRIPDFYLVCQTLHAGAKGRCSRWGVRIPHHKFVQTNGLDPNCRKKERRET